MIKIYPLIFLLFMICATPAVAQTDSANVSYKSWQKAADGVKFEEDKPKPEPKEKEEDEEEKEDKDESNDDRFNWIEWFNSFGWLFKVLAYVLLGGLVVFIIVKLYPLIEGRNKKITSLQQLKADKTDLEDHFHRLSFDDLIQEALENQDYNLAIRLTYLKLLSVLSDGKIIKWHKKKTNFEYISEMNGLEIQKPFRALTNTFEIFWYGQKIATQKDFEKFTTDVEPLIPKPEDG